MATLFQWVREPEYFELNCCIMGRTYINSLPGPPTSSLPEFTLILCPSAQKLLWPTMTEEWSSTMQARGWESFPHRPKNSVPCDATHMAVWSFFSTAELRTAWKGKGHDENVIWGWSEHCVCGVLHSRTEKIMLTVDSALCGFQTFIYSGYTLRPFFYYYCFEKVT